MYKHVFWDFDGTLFDTYPVMAEAFRIALNKEGITEKTESIIIKMKISMSYAYEYYSKKYILSKEFNSKFRDVKNEMEEIHSHPFPESADICKAVCKIGSKNYLYTHKDTFAITLLKKHNMYKYFSGAVTKEDGFARKPSPDALLHMMKVYNISPESAIMIGDRELDILSAKNAGIAGCLLCETETDKPTQANYTIKNLQELYQILSI